MIIAGIIAEYNPFHNGHKYHIEETRRRLEGRGEPVAILCVMSGNCVQRGSFAQFEKHARAGAALENGADLVLELPVPWAISSAEGFAQGAMAVLDATGLVEAFSFGSESADLDGLKQVASCLRQPTFSDRLKSELADGSSFPTARQRAVETLKRGSGKLLSRPNDTLAVEYLKAQFEQGSAMEPMAVLRSGASLEERGGATASAAHIRSLLDLRDEENARRLMPASAWARLERELREGRGPVNWRICERAVLARLRGLDEEEFAALPDGSEGLYLRLMKATRQAASVGEIIERTKSRRYTHARIRRMLFSAYLGITKDSRPAQVPYLRVLGMNPVGRQLLRAMQDTARLPILTKPAHVRKLGEAAQQLFALETRSTDLFALCYPALDRAIGGQEWTTGPVIAKHCPVKR